MPQQSSGDNPWDEEDMEYATAYLVTGVPVKEYECRSKAFKAVDRLRELLDKKSCGSILKTHRNGEIPFDSLPLIGTSSETALPLPPPIVRRLANTSANPYFKPEPLDVFRLTSTTPVSRDYRRHR